MTVHRQISVVSQLRSGLSLMLVTLRRSLRPTPLIICAISLAAAAAVTYALTFARTVDWPERPLQGQLGRMPDADLDGDGRLTNEELHAYNDERKEYDFTIEIVSRLYVGFLLPIFCLTFAAGSISGEREDNTLIYMLITPMPRPLIFAARYAAVAIPALVWTIGGLAALCAVSGGAGWGPLARYWPAISIATLSYVGLFLIFSILFKRATILALLYALFLEGLVGGLPGTVKRIAISFYARCLIFDAGAEFGLNASGGGNPDVFLPVTATTAWLTITIAAAGLFLLGVLLFSEKEHA